MTLLASSLSDHEAVDAEQHKHCECVEALSVKLENAEGEFEVLRSRINHLEDRASSLQDGQEHVFSISRIKNSTKLLSFYTGVTSYLIFQLPERLCCIYENMERVTDHSE